MNAKCPNCNENTISIIYINLFISSKYKSTLNSYSCKECNILILYDLDEKLDGIYYNDYFVNSIGYISTYEYYYDGFKVNIYNKSTVNIFKFDCKSNLIYKLNDTYTSSINLLNALKKVIDNEIFI